MHTSTVIASTLQFVLQFTNQPAKRLLYNVHKQGSTQAAPDANRLCVERKATTKVH